MPQLIKYSCFLLGITLPIAIGMKHTARNQPTSSLRPSLATLVVRPHVVRLNTPLGCHRTLTLRKQLNLSYFQSIIYNSQALPTSLDKVKHTTQDYAPNTPIPTTQN